MLAGAACLQSLGHDPCQRAAPLHAPALISGTVSPASLHVLLGIAVRTGRPVDSGISLQAVRELGPDFPLFGVCMGHQCIGEAFGGEWDCGGDGTAAANCADGGTRI